MFRNLFRKKSEKIRTRKKSEKIWIEKEYLLNMFIKAVLDEDDLEFFLSARCFSTPLSIKIWDLNLKCKEFKKELENMRNQNEQR